MIITDAEKFNVEAVLPYPSAVYNILNCFDEFINKRGDRYVKVLFENIRKKVKEEQGKDYFDNKIAYRVRHKETGVVIYVGYYDDRYSIGLSAQNRDDENRVIEFGEK